MTGTRIPRLPTQFWEENTVSREDLLKLLKGFGDQILVDLENPIRFPPISTGILSVDWVTGGGLYRSMINMDWGPEEGGKSIKAYLSCIQAQQVAPDAEVAYVDMENKLRDYEFLEALGMDLRRFNLLRPGNGDIAADVVTKLIESDTQELVVIDSITDMLPTVGHMADSMQDAQMALVARLMSKWLPVIKPVLGMSHTALLLISQERVNIGGFSPRGVPVQPTGGKAVRQAAVVINKITRRGVITGQDGDAVGITSRVVNRKNQMEPPYRQAEYDFYFKPAFGHEIGIDQSKDVFTIATTLKVIELRGRTYYFRDEKLEVGKEKVASLINLDKDLQAEIRKDVMASKAEVEYEPEDDYVPQEEIV